MINFENLNSSEKLCALLDGELSASESSILFFELAQNTDLQEEMKDHLSLRSFMGASQVAPPDRLRNKILIGTGLMTGGMAGGSAVSAGLGRFLSWGIFNKLILVLTSALLGSLATIFLLNQGDNSSNNLSRNDNNGKSNIPVIVSKEEPARISESGLKTQARVKSQSNPIQNNNYGNDYNAGPESLDAVSLNNDNSEAIGLNTDSPDPIYAASITVPDEYYSNELNRHGGMIDEPGFRKMQLAQESALPRELSLQIRAFTARSIPEFNLAPLDNPTFNNMAISMFYKFHPNFSVGFEAGQENFLQQYDGYDDDGRYVAYKQNYNGFWSGIAFQYDFEELQGVSGLMPMARVMIGGAKVGPMVRGMFALQYNYMNSFSLYTGIESSALFYRYNDNYFSTSKLGLTFGGSVKF
jgi:hypothetical protein